MAGVRNVGENASAKVARLTNICATLLKHRQHQIHIFNVHSKMVDADWSLFASCNSTNVFFLICT